MSGICGWSALETWNPESVLDSMLAAAGVSSAASAMDALRSTAGASAIGVTAATGTPAQLHVDRAGISVGLMGRARFAGASVAGAREHETARAIAIAFASEREACFRRISGAFALVVVDHSRNSVVLAVDRMGIHSLSFVQVEGGCVFASSNSAIDGHPRVRAEVDPQALYQYFYFHVIPAPSTIFRGFQRLVPGQYAVVESGRVRTGQYWSPTFHESYRTSLAHLEREFLPTLRDAVRDASSGAKTGCFLSGGTDSSTLAGLLRDVTGAPPPTYSIGFEEVGYDEMSYARIAAKHFGTVHHEYYVTADDIADAIAPTARAFDQPYGNSSVVPAFYCARMAQRDGIEQLLGGDGGDELFGGNARYAKQYVFSLYDELPGVMRSALRGPLIPRWTAGVPLLRKVRSYVDQASIPMPDRLESYNLLDRIGHEAIFERDFLAQVDVEQPRALLRSIYGSVEADAAINRMLGLDFRITLADNDLPKVKTACSLAGIGVQFPLLDDRVVAFASKLAPELKLKRTQLRYFFKHALRDYLPPEIIAKQKHGFGLPFGPWLQKSERLRGVVNDSLSDLKQRGIVRPELIDNLLSTRLTEHAGYYGTLVWVLVMLEQWFASRPSRSSST